MLPVTAYPAVLNVRLWAVIAPPKVTVPGVSTEDRVVLSGVNPSLVDHSGEPEQGGSIPNTGAACPCGTAVRIPGQRLLWVSGRDQRKEGQTESDNSTRALPGRADAPGRQVPSQGH